MNRKFLTAALGTTAFLFSAVSAVPAHAQARQTQAEKDAQITADAKAYMESSEYKRVLHSAESGDPYSMVKLGIMLDENLPARFDEQVRGVTLKWLMLAAEQEYAPAYYHIGMNTKPEDGIPYFIKGADSGDLEALRAGAKILVNPAYCSVCKLDRNGEVQLDTPNFESATIEAALKLQAEERQESYEKGIELLTRPLAAGDERSEEMLVHAYIDGGHVPFYQESHLVRWQPSRAPEAVALLKTIAEQKTIHGRWANYMLGMILIGGFEVVAQDAPQAAEYLATAAELGHGQSATMLGDLMMGGTVLDKNPVEAVRFFTMAMELGDSDGITSLGVSYLTGAGVDQSDAAAILLFEAAGDMGNEKAAGYAATMWEAGVNDVRNPMKAQIWKDKQVVNAGSGRDENAKKMAQLFSIPDQ